MNWAVFRSPVLAWSMIFCINNTWEQTGWQDTVICWHEYQPLLLLLSSKVTDYPAWWGLWAWQQCHGLHPCSHLQQPVETATEEEAASPRICLVWVMLWADGWSPGNRCQVDRPYLSQQEVRQWICCQGQRAVRMYIWASPQHGYPQCAWLLVHVHV